MTDLATCLNHYRMASPGVYCCIHVEVCLSDDVAVTPGIVLMVDHGRMRTAGPDDGHRRFLGPPNFIADVFASQEDPEYVNRSRQLSDAQVAEYMAVFDTDPVTWRWHHHDGKSFQILPPDEDGILRSKALPGMWIPEESLARRDWWSILATITRGVTRRGHHEFMDSIWNPG